MVSKLKFGGGTVLVASILGGLQDIISAGSVLGFLLPLILSVVIVLAVIIPENKINLPYWKWNLITSLIVLAIFTSIVAYYSEKTESGVIATQVPLISELQKELGLVRDTLDRIEKTTIETSESVKRVDMVVTNTQHGVDTMVQSQQGQLLSINPINKEEWLKNAIVNYAVNRDYTQSLKDFELYLKDKKSTFQVDTALMYFDLLEKNGFEPVSYIKNNFPNYMNNEVLLFAIYFYMPKNLENINELTQISINEKGYLAIKIFLMQQYILRSGQITLRMQYHLDEIHPVLKNSSHKLNQYFYGGLLSDMTENYVKWKNIADNYQPYTTSWNYSSQQEHIKDIINIGISGGMNAKICIYKKPTSLGSGVPKNSHLVVNVNGSVFKVDNVPTAQSMLSNCGINLANHLKLGSENNRVAIKYIEPDGQIYGEWIYEISGVNKNKYGSFDSSKLSFAKIKLLDYPRIN